MEMIVMAPPWPDFIQPAAITFFVFAHLHLGTWKYENPRNTFVFCGRTHNGMLIGAPIAVYKCTLGAAIGNRRQIGALVDAQFHIGAGHQPYICVQPDLMRTMTRGHRPTTGLRHITDIKPVGPIHASRFSAQGLDEIDQFGMPPIAIAGHPHFQPRWPRLRQLNAACQTPLRVSPKCGWSLVRGFRFAAEQLLG